MIDIITINKDNKDGLEKTILSVINQTKFDEINYIIIDGGSTDGSKEIIKKYKKYFGYSTSRKDNGIFNAFNKALSHLKGDYVLFLNSGDYLFSETIIEDFLTLCDGSTIVYGNQEFRKILKGYGSKLHEERILGEEVNTRLYPFTLDEAFFKMDALPHQSTFIKSDYMKQHPYSEDYKIIGDWIMLREAIIDNEATYQHIPITVSSYGLDGISAKNGLLFVNEKTDYYKRKRQ